MISLLAVLYTFASSAFAQNPCEPSVMAEMKSDYARLYYSVQCIEIKQRNLLENREEIDRFLTGNLMKEYKNLFRNVIRLYPVYEAKCANPTGLDAEQVKECKSFDKRLRNSPFIQNDLLHVLLLVNDLPLIREWVESSLPLYDFNRMVRYLDLRSTGRRFTYAEVIAGDRNARLDTLQYIDSQGLLDPKSDESYPLHNAVAGGHLENVRYLVSRGWDVNARAIKPIERYLKPGFVAEGQRGTTPVIAAIINKREDVFKYLMSLPNIDVNVRQKMLDSTALMVAADGAFFDNNPQDPYYWTLFNHPQTNLNERLSDKTPQTVLNLLASKFRDPNAHPAFARMIEKLGSDPRFKADEHCHDKNPCLQAFLPPREGFPYDAERFESFEAIVRKINPAARGYNLQVTKDLTLLEYVDYLVAETRGPYRRDLKRIRSMISSWIGTER